MLYEFVGQLGHVNESVLMHSDIDKRAEIYDIATYALFESLGIPMHLRDVGIDDSRLAEMAHHIAVNEGLDSAWAPLSENDILEILKASL